MTYPEWHRDKLFARFGEHTHELFERSEWIAKLELERHLVDALKI